MAEQVHKQEKKTTQEEHVDETTAQAAGEVALKGEALKADLDELLDDIDEVLESNAEDFVKSYIQKGGE